LEEVKWQDGLVSWVKMRAMKLAMPIETAECAVANKFVD
jgi:hypothetical protein